MRLIRFQDDDKRIRIAMTFMLLANILLRAKGLQAISLSKFPLQRYSYWLPNSQCHHQQDSALFATLSDGDRPNSEQKPTNAVMENKEEGQSTFSIWGSDVVKERVRRQRRNNKSRFRQHVNPLARRYQQPTQLDLEWPKNIFTNCQKPLHLDIGSGKGGFLLDLAGQRTQNNTLASQYNYLGLEIRPMVATFAEDRIATHKLNGILGFVGCNANVDLDRLLTLYHEAANEDNDDSDDDSQNPQMLEVVTIQFPDPHFKTAHAKRRVVTDHLVRVLAEFMPPNAVVFLQSDVKSVLDEMRWVFGNSTEYFQDQMPEGEYMQENLIGVPTEREVSVLVQDLPVYRSVFHRTQNAMVPSNHLCENELD